jgi:hypothetical protein
MDPDVPTVDQSGLYPRAEFNVVDGDTKFLFLQSNAVVMSKPCDDPWFSMHQAYEDQLANATLYRADNLAEPMGCVEKVFSTAIIVSKKLTQWRTKYQFCNPHKNNSCTPLTAILPAIGAAKRSLRLTPLQLTTLDLFFNAIYALNADISTPSQQGSSLLAEQLIMDMLVPSLPNNQWILELQDMHNTVLSMLQRYIVDYARGPRNPIAQQFIETPKSGPAKELCGMIRVRADGRFSNISTYSLSLTIAFGSLIILADLFIVSIISCVHAKRKISSASHDAWIADGLHQVQRRLFEAQGQGVWKNEDASVPVTTDRDMLLGAMKMTTTAPPGSLDEESGIGVEMENSEGSEDVPIAIEESDHAVMEPRSP